MKIKLSNIHLGIWFFVTVALLCSIAFGVALAAPMTTVSTEEELRAAVGKGSAAGTIKLAQDISLTQALDFAKCPTDPSSDKTIVIDLAGHNIQPGNDEIRKKTLIKVPSGYTFTIRDTSGRNKGSVTGAARAIENSGLFTLMSGGIRDNTGSNDAAGILNDAGGTTLISGGVIENNVIQGKHNGAAIFNRDQLQITGGVIQNNSTSTTDGSENSGGAIYNSEHGIVHISGGTIQKNVAQRGGAIFNKSNAEMLILAGRAKIQENNATSRGGGVYNEGGNAEKVKFSMMGSVMTKNTAEEGAGIYNKGGMAVSSGNINNNTASGMGGGLYQAGDIWMSGSIIIKGNKGDGGIDNDTYVLRDKVIMLENAFMSQAKVGIVCDRPNPVFTYGYKACNPNAKPDAFFFPNPNGRQTDTRIMIDEKADPNELRCFVVLHVEDPKGGEKEVFEYFDIEKGTDHWGDWGQTKWAAVRKDVKINDDIGVRGDFNLILCSGARLTTEEIAVRRDDDTRAHLIIWNTTGGLGGLVADGSDSSSAGIGFKANSGGVGKITINGGSIAAFGGSDSAGIGGTENRGNGPITINGGKVYAKGGKYGAGIGAGQGGDQDNYIHIYGGTVEAYGGKNAAGIGGGDSDRGGADGGKTVIKNAKVYAYGGDDAAGIGGGQDGDGSDVTISNSQVTAEGGHDGAGIGGGCEDDWGGTCRIEKNSVVYAKGGGNSAAIGGGYDGCGGRFEIENSKLYATAGNNCADAIGAGHKDYHEGTKSIGSNLKVLAGDTESKATIRLANDRVKACFNKYVQIEPCNHPESSVTYEDNQGPSQHKVIGGCLYCDITKTENLEPHNFNHDSHACICGHIEESISLRKSEDSYVQTFYQSRGSQYTLTTTSPTSANLIFGGWKVSGLDPLLNPGINDGDILSAGTTIVVAKASSSQGIMFTAQWIPASEHVHGLSHVDEVPATCTDPGMAEHWVCDQGNSPCGNYFKDSTGLNPTTEQDLIIEPLGHDWKNPEYDWSDDYTRCTAHIECLRDAAHNTSVEAIILPVVEKEATCTKKGGKFVNAVFFTLIPKIHSQQHYFETIDPLGHQWGTPTYEWSETHDACTGKRICEHDSTHVDEEEVNATITTTDASCTHSGHIDAKATFTNPAFSDQEWVGEGVNPYGHDWEEPTYTWSTDYGKCMALRYCKNNPLHINLARVETKSIIETAATCTEPGQQTYTAEFKESYFEDQTTTVATKALGHEWSDWEVVDFVPGAPEHKEERHCTRVGCSETQQRMVPGDGHNHLLEEVKAKSPTCTLSGIKFNYWKCPVCGRMYSDKDGINEITEEDVTVPPLGHQWRDPSYTWSDDHSACVARRHCVRNPLHFQIAVGEVQSSVLIKPTCTTVGTNSYTATFDNPDFKGIYMLKSIAPLGHEWQDWKKESDPTCTEPGMKTRTCNRDASHVEHQEISALGHDWNDWITVIPATEKKEGSEKRTCKNNPLHTQTRVVPRIGHKHYLTKVEGIEPTCTKPGMREYWICEEGLDPCGHIFTNSAGVEELHESDLPIPALGHNWQEPTYEWDIDNTTCTAKRICANDETEVETEKVATTPTVEKESTCTEGGKISYAAHFTNPAFVDQIKIVHTAEKGHTAGKAVVENANQPSCVLAGSHDIVTYCATCSAEMDRRTLYDAPLGHDWGDWSKVDAQSTDTHIVEKRTCKRVGCGYEEVREIDGEEGHAHTWALVKKVDPTCTTEGEVIWKCTGGGCGATKSQSIATIPHKFGNSSYVNIIDPGCTSYGYSIYLDHCAMCNKIFDGHLVTDPPLSHDWSEWHVKKPATETESGEQERICNNNHAHVETLIINPIGHTWTDWAVVTPPTTTSEGLEKRTCTGCGAEETRTLPALFVYTLNFAEKGTWKKGTETPLILNLKRSFKNQETYDLFSEISVDKQWVPAISIEGVTYFTIRKGHSFVDDSSDTSQGLELIMMPDYLETLSTGNHSVIVRFVDGLTIGLFAVQSADPSEDPEGDTPDPEKHGEGKGGSSKDPVDPVDPIDPDFPEGDTETNGSRGKAGADDDPSDPADNDNKHTGSNKDKKNSSTEESDEETPYGDNKKIAASESDQMPKTADGLSIMPCALVSLLSLCVAMKVRFRRDRLANRSGSKNLK